ncbi:MAG: helix-turn-helix domain-containing protein [Desulfuromonadaceae bacterium]
MSPDNFGKYLKQLREDRGLTIRQVETYTGVSNSYLSLLENGKRGIPSPDILKKIAFIYKVTYEELMVSAGHLAENESIGRKSPLLEALEMDRDKTFLIWFKSLPTDLQEFLRDKESKPWLEMAKDMKEMGVPQESVKNVLRGFAEAINDLKNIGVKLDETIIRELSKGNDI